MASQPSQSQSNAYLNASWVVSFGVLSAVLLLMGNSDKYGEVAAALAVLIATGVFFTQFDKIRAELNSLFGSNL